MMVEEEKLNTTTGERLRECRKALYQTLEQLAEASGYSVQHIIRIEKDRQRMTLEAAEIFSSVLHVRKEYLLNQDDYKTLAEKQKDDLDISNDLTNALFELLSLLGYSIEQTEAVYEDIKTGKLRNLHRPEDVDFKLPDNTRYIGNTNGYVVFEQSGKLQTLKEEDFIKQFSIRGKFKSAKFELTYYDLPDKVILTDYELTQILDEILTFVEFVMDRQKDIRKHK